MNKLKNMKIKYIVDENNFRNCIIYDNLIKKNPQP